MSYASLPSTFRLVIQRPRNIQRSASTSDERRNKFRYPLALDVSYRTADIKGRGTTINFSSSGILLAVSEPLPASVYIELNIDWPFNLENRIPLQIWVRGRVVRVHSRQAAIAIEHYEFRTVARASKDRNMKA